MIIKFYNNKNSCLTGFKSIPHKTIVLGLSGFLLASCSSGGSSPPPATGDAPVVTTSEFVVVSMGESVSLTAVATDAEGDPITFSWRQNGGTSVANPAGFATSSASFDAPANVDSIGFTLTVSSSGHIVTEDVTVVVVEDTDTAVFVDNSFTGTSTGAINAPYSTLVAAVQNTAGDYYLKTTAGNNSYTTGMFSAFQGGESLYGGYDERWLRDPVLNRTNLTGLTNNISNTIVLHVGVDEPTTVSGFNLFYSDAEPQASDLTAISAEGGSSTYTVENNSIILPSVLRSSDSFSPSNVLGVLSLVDNPVIRNNDIDTGDASESGEWAAQGGSGGNGAAGTDAQEGNNLDGGSGGSGGGGWNGGRGGDAGNNSNESGNRGSAGGGRTSPVVVNGGNGGTGGLSINPSTGSSVNAPIDGRSGGDGQRGVIGANGQGAIAFLPDMVNVGGFNPRFGANGSDGWAGGGGGGGGGGAASNTARNGGAGGGGGEGGDGGNGGFGAYSGGASIGIAVLNSVTAEISGNTILTGNGGTGALGGAGQSGGAGGNGGAGAPHAPLGLGPAGGDGGDGGNGGRGGAGGFGGSGAGGPSFGIYLGENVGGTINGNTIVTGNGGNGGNAADGNDASAAGEGGWSYGIFDNDPDDGISPSMSGNSITVGSAGTHGSPATGSGQSGMINTP